MSSCRGVSRAAWGGIGSCKPYSFPKGALRFSTLISVDVGNELKGEHVVIVMKMVGAETVVIEWSMTSGGVTEEDDLDVARDTVRKKRAIKSIMYIVRW